MSESANKGLEVVQRPLTEQECDLVRWLIEHSHLDSSRLLSQIERLSVAEKCSCGCPTVYFALDGVPVTRKGEQLISDWRAEVDGNGVGVMLFQTDDGVSSLEVYSIAGTDKPFGLPAIGSIRGY
jgi:hypothetical protein